MHVNMNENIGPLGPNVWIEVKFIVSGLAELYCTRRHSVCFKWLFPASAYPPAIHVCEAVICGGHS